MKNDHRKRWLMLGICVVSLRFVARAATEEDAGTGRSTPAKHGIHVEALQLIREDAQKRSVAAVGAAAQPAESKSPEHVGEQPEGGFVLLEAFDVQGERELPNFTAPPETKVATFFRTGNFAQHIGKKVTTRFWTSGDAGLVWSLRW